MDINNFQRVGSVSNAHVGRDFESVACAYFKQCGITLESDFAVPVGVATDRKNRRFDLGSSEPAILVESKSHRWTSGGNIPSAKITVWNEAMYYFHIAPIGFLKVLFVLRDFSQKRQESLAMYYVRNYGHLVPVDVEILEYDEPSESVLAVLTTASTGTGFCVGAPKPVR